LIAKSIFKNRFLSFKMKKIKNINKRWKILKINIKIFILNLKT
jgi:hypothetical protein